MRENWIQTPEGAPEWANDRQELWTAVDKVEKRKDAQTARELEIALPRELTPDQQRQLIRGFVGEELVVRGMVADVGIHEGHDASNPNPHAHVLLTTRTINPEGFGAKARDWNKTELLQHWREAWQKHANQALERAGRPEQVDHRTLEAQGIDDRLPGTKLGPAVTAMERRGEVSARAEEARAAQAEYKAVVIDLAAARAEKERLLKELQEQRETARTARDEQASFGRRPAGWTREAAEAVQTLEGSLGRLAKQADILREMERLDREEVAPLRTALVEAQRGEANLVADIRKLETEISVMEMRIRAGRVSQEDLDRHRGIAGLVRQVREFRTWPLAATYHRQTVAAGIQAEKDLPAARASLGQTRRALPQVQQRIKTTGGRPGAEAPGGPGRGPAAA